jgi:hypothetical protein
MHTEAVDAALQRVGDVLLAERCAERVEENDALRRKLWLRIAEYVLTTRKDVKL